VVCITFTDWFRGRTSVCFVLLLLIGLEDGLHRSSSSKSISKSNTNHTEVHPLNQSVKVIQTHRSPSGLEEGLLCVLYDFY
jgi:hypothetical protein